MMSMNQLCGTNNDKVLFFAYMWRSALHLLLRLRSLVTTFAASPATGLLTLTPLLVWLVPCTQNQNRTFPMKCRVWSLRRTQHFSLSSYPPACLRSCST